MSSDFGQSGGVERWTRQVNSIMDEMLNRSFVDFRSAGAWQPATDVYETRDRYYICVELAGVDERAVDVTCLDGRRVRISGTRPQPRPQDQPGPLSVHVLEIDEGPFLREIDLPETVRIEDVDATYSKGYLWVMLPKKQNG
jgi:HSP20 family protein